MLAVAMTPMAASVYYPATQPCSYSSYPRRRRDAVVVAASAASSSPEETKDVVIVGAGIAGLATALSLRRLGVGATVLEQGPSLRAGGTSLTLFKNGWRVLDSIGVADELRAKYLRVQGYLALPALLSVPWIFDLKSRGFQLIAG
jgi:NADPH-dependent 2,4-dienoyl-CoA reductase/sulfur reductase-like enzyme